MGGGWDCSLFTRRVPRKTCMPTMFIYSFIPLPQSSLGLANGATVKPQAPTHAAAPVSACYAPYTASCLHTGDLRQHACSPCMYIPHNTPSCPAAGAPHQSDKALAAHAESAVTQSPSHNASSLHPAWGTCFQHPSTPTAAASSHHLQVQRWQQHGPSVKATTFTQQAMSALIHTHTLSRRGSNKNGSTQKLQANNLQQFVPPRSCGARQQ